MLGKSDEEVEKEIKDIYTSEDQELTKEELYELLRKKIKRPGEESPEKIITEQEQQSPMIEVRVEHIYDINQVQAIPDLVEETKTAKVDALPVFIEEN